MTPAEELEEAVAKTICQSQGTPISQYEVAEHYWRIYARAAIRVVLEAAAEVAAKRYKDWTPDGSVECDFTACKDIAMAIAALMPEEDAG